MKQAKFKLLPQYFQDFQITESVTATNNKPRLSDICSKRPSAVDKVERIRSQKFNNKIIHSKTQAIQKSNKYQLPQINSLKNPLVQMKFNEVQRGSKVILKSSKNTRILNQMIDILTDNSTAFQGSKKRQESKANFKKMITETCDNQFMQDRQCSQKCMPMFERSSKAVHPDFINLFRKNRSSQRRKIHSEQRTRPKPKIKKSLNININPIQINNSNNTDSEQNHNLLTFYNPNSKFINNHTNNKKNRQQEYKIEQKFKNINEQFNVQI